MSLKGPSGDCGGAQQDKDPGDLAGKEWERRALTRGPGMAAGAVSACVRRALRAERRWRVGSGAYGGGGRLGREGGSGAKRAWALGRALGGRSAR